MAERGHSLESIKASIESRKPDFDAYIGKLPKFSGRWILHSQLEVDCAVLAEMWNAHLLNRACVMESEMSMGHPVRSVPVVARCGVFSK